jgi:hypothetical protein
MVDHYKHITSCAIRRLAEAFFGTKTQRVYVEQDGRDSLVLREIEEGLRLERQSHEDARYFTLQELEAEKEARKAVAESLHKERALRQAAESALWACSKQLAEARDPDCDFVAADRQREVLQRCSVRQSLAESRLQAARDNLAVKLKLQEDMYVAERLANSRLLSELEDTRLALTEARGEVASLKEAARITQEIDVACLKSDLEDLQRELDSTSHARSTYYQSCLRLEGVLVEVIQERDDLRSALEQAGNKLDRVRGAVEALKALGLDLEAKLR